MVYEACDHLAESEVGSLIERLRAAPEVTVTPPSDSAAVMKTVCRALERAGYRLSDYLDHPRSSRVRTAKDQPH
jgi:hypothetical protein